MKFLLIHQVFLTPRDGGGTRHFEFARAAVKRGHDFAAVASDVSYLDGKPIDSPTNPEVIEGVRVFRARTLRSLHRSFAWRVLSFLSFMVTAVFKGLAAGKVDLVMGTSPPMPQALSAWIVSVLRRRPFLMEVRDLWPDFAVDMGVIKNPLLIWCARRLEVFLYRRADHLVVNSPAYREYLIQERGIDPRRVSLVPNGVDPAMFDPQEKGAGIREEFGVGDKFLVVYAGAVGLANDLSTLMRAADRLREREDVHFLIVGNGKELPNVRQLADELALENVTFAGVRPKSEMKLFLGAADVCVATLMNIPMFKTTYPNKIFDYMAAARPIVLGIDGVIREVVERAEGGVFVEPGDDLALSEAVSSLASRRSECVAMGLRGRAYVNENFNRQDQAAQFIQMLESIVSDPEPVPVGV